MEQVESRDGTKIGFERSGSGDPLVLVHGATGSTASWAMVAPILSERFTVFNMDRRGRATSGDGAEYSLDAEVRDIAAVVGAIGRPVHLVGHSFGACLALKYAKDAAGELRSMVLYEPPLATTKHVPAGVVARAEALMRGGDPAAAAELFLAEAAAVLPEELAMLKSLPPVWERVTEGIATVPREVRALDADQIDLAAGRGIDVPTLFVVGGDTTAPIYLDGLDELERSFPNASRTYIPGQRHLAVGFAPEALAQAIVSFCAAV